MKNKGTGIVLVIIGILMMVYTGFNIVTKEKVVDIGPVEISKTKKTPVNWPPVLGALFLIGGVAIIATSKSK
ncbi:MAG: hypothetical protein KA444_04055 [Bacteroidia bacterium]|nr:hypothetical protein [Bacteroidia bacterium]